MRSRLMLSLVLATFFSAPALAAQAAPASGAGAIRSLSDMPPPAGGAAAHHLILTLAWTDITIPASLDRPASSPHLVAHSAPRIYTLVWQDAGSAEREGARVAEAPPLRCQTTVLVTVSCE